MSLSAPQPPSRPSIDWKKIQAGYLNDAARQFSAGKSEVYDTLVALNRSVVGDLLGSGGAIQGDPATVFNQIWFGDPGIQQKLNSFISQIDSFITAMQNQATTWLNEYNSAMSAYDRAMSQYNTDMDSYNKALASSSSGSP